MIYYNSMTKILMLVFKIILRIKKIIVKIVGKRQKKNALDVCKLIIVRDSAKKIIIKCIKKYVSLRSNKFKR